MSISSIPEEDDVIGYRNEVRMRQEYTRSKKKTIFEKAPKGKFHIYDREKEGIDPS